MGKYIVASTYQGYLGGYEDLEDAVDIVLNKVQDLFEFFSIKFEGKVVLQACYTDCGWTVSKKEYEEMFS